MNICEATLYVSLSEAKKVVNLRGGVDIKGVNICDAALYYQV